MSHYYCYYCPVPSYLLVVASSSAEKRHKRPGSPEAVVLSSDATPMLFYSCPLRKTTVPYRLPSSRLVKALVFPAGRLFQRPGTQIRYAHQCRGYGSQAKRIKSYLLLLCRRSRAGLSCSSSLVGHSRSMRLLSQLLLTAAAVLRCFVDE